MSTEVNILFMRNRISVCRLHTSLTDRRKENDTCGERE